MSIINVQRSKQNPIIKTSDIRPSHPGLQVNCVLNPGVFEFQGKIWLVLRVAERPIQKEGMISFPVMRENGELEILEFNKNDPSIDFSDARYITQGDTVYLTTISHLRLVNSVDGVHFQEPEQLPSIISANGPLESFGIEDCRVALLNNKYYLTYTQVSENGVGVGLMSTKNWKDIDRLGMILPPHNKDCALFEEQINGKYFCFHRPSGIDLGGNFIWIAESTDLIHWGNHRCILKTREDMWDSARVGAGASPIKTPQGWLSIYHGADSKHRYCLGAVLLDLENPQKVLARSMEPILQPETDYELNGFFGNVVFTNGHIIKEDNLTIYYGASDEVICIANLSIIELLNSLIAETAKPVHQMKS